MTDTADEPKKTETELAVERLISVLKSIGREYNVIGDGEPFVEKDCRIKMDLVCHDDTVFVRSGDLRTEIPISVLEGDMPFSVDKDGLVNVSTVNGIIVLGDRPRPIPIWLKGDRGEGRKKKKKPNGKIVETTVSEGDAYVSDDGEGPFMAVINALAEVGIGVTHHDHDMFDRQMVANGRYYGKATFNHSGSFMEVFSESEWADGTKTVEYGDTVPPGEWFTLLYAMGHSEIPGHRNGYRLDWVMCQEPDGTFSNPSEGSVTASDVEMVSFHHDILTFTLKNGKTATFMPK